MYKQVSIIPENEKVNYEPLALFYKFFKVVPYPTNIRGYWKDEQGKLYIDHIQKVNISVLHYDYLQALIDKAYSEGEKAVFFKNVSNEAVIVSPNEKPVVLKNQTHIIEDKKPSSEYIKELLENADGLTVYQTFDRKYLIEIYK